MIIRTIGDEVFVTPQPKHAVASGALASRVRCEFFDPETRAEAVLATVHHDDGWREWERQPDRWPQGAPRNFTELESPSHLSIWRRGVADALEELPPAAAVLIAHHASNIVGAPGLNKDFIAEAEERSAQAAWPAVDPAERRRRIAMNYAVLAMCDVLTLMVCADWPEDRTLELLNEDGTRPFPVPARRDGDWDLRLLAWPFAGDEVEITVEMTRVRKPVDWDAVLAEIAAERSNWRQRVRLRRG